MSSSCSRGDRNQWNLRPLNVDSFRASELPPIQWTHSRKMPLPLYITIKANTSSCYEGYYAGHGLTKVAYRLCTTIKTFGQAHETILKMTPEYDQEPIVFRKLPRNLCPEIYAHGECLVYKNAFSIRAEQPEIWNAWTTQVAFPCDQALQTKTIDVQPLVWHIVYCICSCAAHGLLLDDNSLGNFGIIHAPIVVIDAGRKVQEESPIEKNKNLSVPEEILSDIRLVGEHRGRAPAGR